MLTDNQEMWILQQVIADYERYEDIRRALRRMPGLDSRHSPDAQAYPVYNTNNNNIDSSTDDHSWSQDNYDPFRAHSLQKPPPEEHAWPGEDGARESEK